MKTQIKVSKAKPILGYSRICLILGGIWPLPLQSQNRVLQRAYSIYSGLMRFYLPFMLISLLIKFAISIVNERTERNLEKIFFKLNYIIILLITCFSMMLCQRKEVKEIIGYIMEDDNEIICSKVEDMIQCHLAQVRLCSRSCLAIMILTFGSGISMCFENYWRRLEIDRNNIRYNESVEKPFVFELYYFNLDANKHDTALVVVNDVCTAINSLLCTSTKMLLFSSIIHSASILKRLQIKFEKLYGYRGRVLIVLRDLVQEHQNVIGFVEKLNNWLKYLIFWEFLLDSINIAAVSMQLITSEGKLLISPILFFCVLCSQTFILGWCTNEVKYQIMKGSYSYISIMMND
ncbi:uncharacterized protein LOC132696961 isoform X2 [Cylas formicarius]|uniref:uncharacterized protein LOC132696961 isoform X2 n=1 Tax=Cylas formicarius TaxID=197179 RepID=UPI0029585D33|nr:uncharacterized protein LOC132696961 isoform X2 [Cylas formicarius]